MKTLKYDLIAYAESFVSFVLPKISDVKEIILFGSVSRGEAGKESDIDIFFDMENKKEEKKIKKIIENELGRFYKSKIAEIFFLKGIKNPIKINVGKLDEWKLKRSIISDGICLYGRYKETPKNLKGFVLFNIQPIKNITKRNRIIRKLFGRKEKKYFARGLVEELRGRKLSANSFIVPLEHAKEFINLLMKERVNYIFFELWTDQINL